MSDDRVSVTLHKQRVTAWDRAFYRRCGQEPPPVTWSADRDGHLVRLLPTSWRWIHRVYANRHGFFWLPCVLCNRPYGGHQHGASVPDPIKGGRWYHGICPPCGRKRRKSGLS